jgi:hypothetical protein
MRLKAPGLWVHWRPAQRKTDGIEEKVCFWCKEMKLPNKITSRGCTITSQSPCQKSGVKTHRRTAISQFPRRWPENYKLGKTSICGSSPEAWGEWGTSVFSSLEQEGSDGVRIVEMLIVVGESVLKQGSHLLFMECKLRFTSPICIGLLESVWDSICTCGICHGTTMVKEVLRACT